MLVLLARENPRKNLTLAMLISYNYPVSCNEPPQSVLFKKQEQYASRDLLVFDVVVFTFATKNLFQFSRFYVGNVIASYNKIEFEMEYRSFNYKFCFRIL